MTQANAGLFVTLGNQEQSLTLDCPPIHSSLDPV